MRYSLQQPRAYARANVQCFLELLEAIRFHKETRLVFASSSSVYGSNLLSPFSESSRVDTPNSLYAATKKVRRMAQRRRVTERRASHRPRAMQPASRDGW